MVESGPLGPLVECNDSWGNDAWDFHDIPYPEANGNFSADPLFCDVSSGDLTLQADSPCLPGYHPNGFDCGVIGALGEGCGSQTAVAEERPTDSWTTVKSRFH